MSLPTPPRRSAFAGSIIAHAVARLESQRTLDDARAMQAAARCSPDRRAQVIERAWQLAADTGLLAAWSSWQRTLGWLAVLVAVLVAAMSWGLVASVIGADRQVNAAWAFMALLGPHLLGLVVWLLGLCWPARAGPGLGRLVLSISRHLPAWGAPRQRAQAPLQAMLADAALDVLQTRRTLPWVLGALSHLIWLLAFVVVLAGMLVQFAFRAYQLTWETTILDAGFFAAFVQLTGMLPAALGFAMPDVHTGEARTWAWWLIGCVLVYGALLRMVLAVLSLAVARHRLAGQGLAMNDAYHLRLVQRFERMDAPRVVDAEHAPPAAQPAAAVRSDLGDGVAVIGFELPPDSAWPPPGLPAQAWYARIAGTHEERQALIDRLAAQRPARIVMVCTAAASPDRGTERWMRAALSTTGQLQLRLIGSDPQAAGRRRWSQWLHTSGLDAVTLLPEHEDAHAT